jgi:serine/threonine protein kinase
MDNYPSIPGYTILRQLGQGGMGAVYLGQSTEDSTRQVAIKVICKPLGEGNSHSFITRFKREIEICQGLVHGNIVSTISGGVSEEGALYLILEFLSGCTLEERVSKEKLNEEQAILIGQNLCDALTCIHSRGLYHRDIKPANIVLQENFDPILIDFGLALANNRTRLTDTGLALGTLQTMAPEQLMGKKLKETADIYSLGATLYFSVTGLYPFTGEEIIALASGIPLRRKNLIERLKGKASDSFIDVLLCALETNPSKRFHSASLFKEALSHCSKKLPISRISAPSDSKAKVGFRQIRFLPIFLILIVACIVAASIKRTSSPQSKSNELLHLRRQLLSRSGIPSNSELHSLGLALVTAGEAKSDGALCFEALGQFDLLTSYLRYKRKLRACQMAELFIDSHVVSWYSAGRTLPISELTEAINNTEFEYVISASLFEQIKKVDDLRVKFKMLPLFNSLTDLIRGPTDFHKRSGQLQRLSGQYCKLLEPLHRAVATKEERQHLYECHLQILKMDLRKTARMKALKLLQKAINSPDQFTDIWLVVKYGVNAMLKSTIDNLDDVDTSFHVIAIDALRRVRNRLKSKRQKWEWSMALASQLNGVGKQKEALLMLEDIPLEAANSRDLCNLHFTRAEILVTSSRFEEALLACKKALAASDHNKDTIEKYVLRIKSLQVISKIGLREN